LMKGVMRIKFGIGNSCDQSRVYMARPLSSLG
jgi:hypothetical protein